MDKCLFHTTYFDVPGYLLSMGGPLNWVLIVLSLYPTSQILGMSHLSSYCLLAYFHSKQKPLSLAARSILLPQKVNGLSEGNLHRFTKTKTLSLPFSGEIVGQLSMEFFHS